MGVKARRQNVKNVKRRKRDLDEINEDLKDKNVDKLLNQEVDYDLPGAAQHYCVTCARHFIHRQAILDHYKTKVHKRRLKALETEPYTVKDAEAAAGLGTFKQPQKRKIETVDKEERAEKRSKVEDNSGDVSMNPE
ncbi:hypothetical protein TKK_0003563 [Trichogramma kaykai]|uniref:Zinc finger protein 593 homolog n=1 Tax=Trichogramma kaykai TaxID=54128 RepID=A0ABD2XPP4_9HYME